MFPVIPAQAGIQNPHSSHLSMPTPCPSFRRKPESKTLNPSFRRKPESTRAADCHARRGMAIAKWQRQNAAPDRAAEEATALPGAAREKFSTLPHRTPPTWRRCCTAQQKTRLHTLQPGRQDKSPFSPPPPERYKRRPGRASADYSAQCSRNSPAAGFLADG